MKRRQATIKDIAKAIGVSPSTVSRALNDHPAISKATKERIRAKAKELKYEPNIVALSLKNSRTKTIGVILPELIHYFFSSVIAGMEDIAYENGYTVMVCQSNESHDKEVTDTMALLSHRVDGILISQAKNIENYQHYDEIMSRNVPLVFFDRAPKEIKVPKVGIDDRKAAYNATIHLVESGKKKILHLTNGLNMNISKLRLAGYKKALKNNGIECNEKLIVECESGDMEDGKLAIEKVLREKISFDAIFANNDMLAMGAMNAVKQAGKSIPKEVAIMGFSNWNFCNMVEPPLSSVDQPGREIGMRAMSRLLRMINEDEDYKEESIKLATNIVARGSTIG